MGLTLLGGTLNPRYGPDPEHVRAQLLEDVQEESKKYGAMQGVVVPRPPATVSAEEPARVFIRCAAGAYWLLGLSFPANPIFC